MSPKYCVHHGTMAHGPWPRAHGPWSMAHGPWPMAHGQPQRPPLWLSGNAGDFSTTETCARALKDIKVRFVPLNGIQSDDPGSSLPPG